MFASTRRTLALALRIVRQFVRDRRTMALLFVAPLVVMTILNFIMNNSGTSNLTIGIVAPDGVGSSQVTSVISTALGKVKGVQVISLQSGQVDSTLKAGDA